MTFEINIAPKLKKASLLAQNPVAAFGTYKKLFLISHMRARTSLLSHVLGSNPCIAGYYEQHICHQKFLSDLRLRASLLGENLLTSDTQYLFDKTLHDRLDPLPETRATKVFLLRRADETLQSLITMGQKLGSNWQDPQESFAYYTTRLQSMAEQAARSADKVVLLQSEDIVSRTDEVLAFLTQALALKTPLSAHYKSFDKTGQAVSGDPSENIKSGVIEKRQSNQDIELDAVLLNEATDVYNDVLARIQSCAHVL